MENYFNEITGFMTIIKQFNSATSSEDDKSHKQNLNYGHFEVHSPKKHIVAGFMRFGCLF